MKKSIFKLTQNTFLKANNFSIYKRSYVFHFFKNRSIITSNISDNKEIKIKDIGGFKIKSFKKTKNIKDEKDDDIYILNGKILYAQKNKKEKNESKVNYPIKKSKSLENTDNLFYLKLIDNLKKNNLETDKDEYKEYKNREIRNPLKNEKECDNNNDNNINSNSNSNININSNNNSNNISGNINNKHSNQKSESETFYKKNEINEKLDNYEIKSNDNKIKNTHMSILSSKMTINNEIKNENEKIIAKEEKEKDIHTKNSTNNHTNKIEDILNNKNNSEVKPPRNNRDVNNVKHDVYEILKEINSENDKKEIEKFLNYFLLYKNNNSTNILGNFVSFYFCNILSDDLKDLKYYYFDGVKLSVNSFFNTIRELNEKQLSKMTNIYLKEYFLKIFKILKSQNLNLHFDNLEINNMKLLYIYNILGLIRNDGKRSKKENIKKFLYQYICVENKDIALLKSNSKMKFLTNIIKNGVTTRMHILINLSYDLSTYNTISSNYITKTKFKNINLEFIFENQLENPLFSLQSHETINLKSSGWYLVDVNQILNGNLPYE
ncbi:conserved Plasmodium protein, unknown function [Plasmodium gallinaceum]|uniref:Uncharacterized protein n=1 Tax=Plasmodium gallinaceum TaxID=5849 RepID=A0A1J1GR51_PLAGA|nr:conserved Plasmodium protein, unknown function [Plasmodium gallinaceum]CRG94905.1 conserved Plasmodium protein, unknown function [Plasmodium gallinaceum]